MKQLLVLTTLLFGCVFVCAQNDILLTINDEHFYREEFIRVYEKNSELINKDQYNDPEEYLQLFIDYKLKVQEAYRLGLDKKKKYQEELSSYRSQLAKSYLNDVKVTDELVAEAYDRTVTELKARHILIQLDPNAAPSDTLVAYHSILKARERIVNGEDFKKVAREISEDPSAKKNGGDLGWFKAFKMVYPFENAAYSTSINEVSKPFRTSFGYHIVQPTAKREALGNVQVAHIMVALTQKDTSIIPENRINEVAQLLSNGASFETLALNYSDDNASYKKGGKLNEFEQGQLSSLVFEQKAFSLTKVGTTTAPFKTEFGWHIIKLLARNPVPAFQDLKVALSSRVTRDTRAQVISDKLDNRLRNHYQIIPNESLQLYFENFFPEKYTDTRITLDKDPILSTVAFTLGKGDKKTSYTYKMVGDYLLATYARTTYKSKSLFVKEGINSFVSTILKNYHLEHLEEQDPDFDNILKEYKEGLLLFDLLETNIWKKAQEDSIGLQDFFKSNRSNYRTVKTYNASVFTTGSKRDAKKFKSSLSKGISPQAAVVLLKKNDTSVILSDRRIKENELSQGLSLSKGASDIIKDGESYIVYYVTAITEASDQLLSDVRGVVISDYQKELEHKFIEDIKKRSTITVHKEVLNALIIKYDR